MTRTISDAGAAAPARLSAKRRLLKRALSASGLLTLRWKTLPPGLYCFGYHRIGEAGRCEFDRNVFSCTAGHFEEQVRELQRHFEIITIERLAGYGAGRGEQGKRFALLTFDDGYVDNYAAAFPVLRAHRAPAVFFLPTAFIGTGRIPWWDEIAWLLRHSGHSVIRLPWNGEEVALEAARLEETIRRVLKSLKRAGAWSMQDGVAALREICGAGAPDGQRLFLNWDEIREMRAAGMEFGSHGHSHEVLSHLDPAQQKEELGRSKEILEAALGEPVWSLAYPVGGRDAYNGESCRLARAAGYRFAFTLIRGRNAFPLERPLELMRFSAEDCGDLAHLRLRVAFPALGW